ncbi:MAG: hypothetical protein HOP95_03155 [Sphingomonas sp.]|nr:hypothetical protein [Sphingomonas sp.]
MSKYLIALAIAGVVSVPAAAQPAAQQNATTTNQAQPQMVKKRVCEENDNPATTIHRICRTVMVPAQPNGSASSKAPATNDGPNAGY